MEEWEFNTTHLRLGGMGNGPGTKMTKKEDTQYKYLNNNEPEVLSQLLGFCKS